MTMYGNKWQLLCNHMHVPLRERDDDSLFPEFLPDQKANIALDIFDPEHVVAPEEDLKNHGAVAEINDSHNWFDLRLIVDHIGMFGRTLIQYIPYLYLI